ncbi:MAG TPA: hypothetical protein VL737_03640 [Candidatus Pristimantibacillus sp.]|jgi:hypothetical protein|nr:hypothetical protein [Candidatus Pristimantibacillus sp.]
MKKRLLSGILIAVFVCAAATPRVGATGPSNFWHDHTYLRSCSYAGATPPSPLNAGLCAPIKDYGAGTQLTMLCWKDDFGTRWFLVKISDGTEGYVDEPSVHNQTTVDHCAYAGSVTKKVLAADWALSTVNQVNSSSTLAAHYPGVYWPAPYAWANMCYVFAHYAWYTALQRDPIYAPGAGYAIDVWNHYVSEGKAYQYSPATGQIQPPPYGAMVFWSYVTGGISEGHVGIAVGGDRVVDTHSDGTAQITWENWFDHNRAGNYLGWVPIESVDYR